MKLTNKLNLPTPFMAAVQNDSYSSGGADYSVTTILKPPRIVALEKLHADELEEDVSDRIFALLGQVTHGILERANDTGIAERRMFMEVDGSTISGQMDRYIDGTLQDYKLVTVYKFKDGKVPEEYAEQLNIYSELLRYNKHLVNRLQIVGILRDWSKMEAKRDPSYPQTQIVVRDVPLWPEEKSQNFLRQRIALHKAAAIKLPECSINERWARPTKYAVMKIGKDRAIKLYDNQADAESHASIDKLLFVETRLGQNVRCENYCSVSKYCDQFQSMQKET